MTANGPTHSCRVVVGSVNPVKIAAVSRGFERMFGSAPTTIRGVAVSPPVEAQPRTDAETLAGAAARAVLAREVDDDASYWVGLEGGVHEDAQGMAAFAWVVVVGGGVRGVARTATFYLPEAVAELVREGFELGEADDRVFGRTNSKQQEGAVGLLTGGAIDRRELYAAAVALALVPFRNPALYPAG